LPAGIIELNEVRRDLLTVFGIWIYVLSSLEQREVFGAKFFFAICLSSGTAPQLSRGLFARRSGRVRAATRSLSFEAFGPHRITATPQASGA
jgi:hypothetical protein